MGPRSLSTIGRRISVCVDPDNARWKVGGATVDWDTVDPVQGQNEIVTITISATGGTFTITFGGQTTGNLAYNATGPVVEDALEALSSIGNGNVQVTLAGAVYTIEFIEDLRHTNVGAVTTDPALLTGGAGTAVVAVGTAGSADGNATLADGTIVLVGDKYILPGTVMMRITASDKFGPAKTTASDGREIVTNAVRGDAYVLNELLIKSNGGSDYTGDLFDAGLVYRDRLQIGGTAQPTEANFETMFPGISFVKD